MDMKGAQSGLSLSGPPPEETGEAALSSGYRTPTPPPSSKIFAGMRPAAIAMKDVENLPTRMSRTEVEAMQGLEIEERLIQTEDELLHQVTRRDSLDSIASSESSDSHTGSLASLVSSEGSDFEEDVEPGKRLLRLPEGAHFIWPESLTNLLANLIMDRLSADEKLALPVEVLESFCLQAMGDLQYLMELGKKIQTNIDLLNLPESAVKAITSKLEQTREPYLVPQGGS